MVKYMKCIDVSRYNGNIALQLNKAYKTLPSYNHSRAFYNDYHDDYGIYVYNDNNEWIFYRSGRFSEVSRMEYHLMKAKDRIKNG